MDLFILLNFVGWFEYGLFLLVAVAGIVGAGMALTMNDQAFDFNNRQPKLAWAAMLFVSAIACVGYPMVSMLAIIGVVVIGLFWFDVRPEVKSLMDGNGGW